MYTRILVYFNSGHIKIYIVHTYIYMHIHICHIYIFIHICMCVCVYIYIYNMIDIMTQKPPGCQENEPISEKRSKIMASCGRCPPWEMYSISPGEMEISWDICYIYIYYMYIIMYIYIYCIYIYILYVYILYNIYIYHQHYDILGVS